MSKTQYISRKLTFDSGHRVMNERLKCFSVHGHTYLCELVFEFNEMEEIGYAIDFKEIKRVGCQWIDDMLDHGFIVNPQDSAVITACEAVGSKMWYMGLNGEHAYCNPSVENVSKEIFLAMEILFAKYHNLKIHQVVLNETPNCATTCIRESISDIERDNWQRFNAEAVALYRDDKGVLEYDDRKL